MGTVELMPQASRVPASPPLDYDPEDAERIERLLEELCKIDDPAKKQAVDDKLDELIFGLSNAQD